VRASGQWAASSFSLSLSQGACLRARAPARPRPRPRARPPARWNDELSSGNVNFGCSPWVVRSPTRGSCGILQRHVSEVRRRKIT
jgi:hypothetical protein